MRTDANDFSIEDAALSKDPDLAQAELVKRGILNTLSPLHNVPAIYLAAENNNQGLVMGLLAEKASISQCGVGDILFWSRNSVPLLEHLKKLFSEDPALAAANPDITLAHIHAALGDGEFFSTEENKRKLTEPNRLGVTPAFYASVQGHVNLLQLLNSNFRLINAPSTKMLSRFSQDDYRTIALYLYILGKAELTSAAMKIVERLSINPTLWDKLFLAQCHIRLVAYEKDEKNEAHFSAAKAVLEETSAHYFLPDLWLKLAQNSSRFCSVAASFKQWEAKKPEDFRKYMEREKNKKEYDNTCRQWALFYYHGDVFRRSDEVNNFCSEIRNKTDADFRLLSKVSKTRAEELEHLNAIKNKTDEDYRTIYRYSDEAPITEKIKILAAISDKTCYEFVRLAEFYSSTEDLQKAIESYKKAIGLMIKSHGRYNLEQRYREIADLQKDLLICHLRLKQYQEAELVCRDRNQNSKEGQMRLIDAFVYYKNRNYQTALTKIKEWDFYRNGMDKFYEGIREYIIGLCKWKTRPDVQAKNGIGEIEMALAEFRGFKNFMGQPEVKSELLKYPNLVFLDILFNLATELPFQLVENWLPILNLLRGSPILQENSHYFYENFPKLTKAEQEEFENILKWFTPGSALEIISLDKSCATDIFWMRTCKNNASKSLYANARIYSKEPESLNLKLVIDLCERNLTHYSILASKFKTLPEDKKSIYHRIGNEVLAFLSSITPMLQSKSVNELSRELPEEKSKSLPKNIIRIFLECAFYLYPSNESLARDRITQVCSLYPRESAEFFIDYLMRKKVEDSFINFALSVFFEKNFQFLLENILNGIQTTFDENLCVKIFSLMLFDKKQNPFETEVGRAFFIKFIIAAGKKASRSSHCRQALGIILEKTPDPFLLEIHKLIKTPFATQNGFRELCQTTLAVVKESYSYLFDSSAFVNSINHYLHPQPSAPTEEIPTANDNTGIAIASAPPISPRIGLENSEDTSEEHFSEEEMSSIEEIDKASEASQEKIAELSQEPDEMHQEIKKLKASQAQLQNELAQSRAEQLQMWAAINELRQELKNEKIRAQKTSNAVQGIFKAAVLKSNSTETESKGTHKRNLSNPI